MSADSPNPPSDTPRRSEPWPARGMATPFTAVLGIALYVALVIAGLGVISLLTDGTIVADEAAGPLVGPIMIAVSAAGLLPVLLRLTRGDRRLRPFPIGLCALGAVVAGVGYLVGGALAWLMIGGGAAGETAAFLAHQVVQGYIVAVLFAAAAVSLTVAALVRTDRPLSG